VNFELPNVAEDYVHRIGRTGRAGSIGAAISLVDSEELQHLKNIERLIKREIPKVAVETFVPPTHLPKEAPRPPRHTQQRRGGNGARGNGNTRARGNTNGREQAQPPNGQQPSKSRQGKKSPPTQQFLSEAARHQSMPQPALFSPKPPPRRGR